MYTFMEGFPYILQNCIEKGFSLIFLQLATYEFLFFSTLNQQFSLHFWNCLFFFSLLY